MPRPACPSCDVCGASAPTSLTSREGTVNLCGDHDTLTMSEVRAIMAAAELPTPYPFPATV